MSQIDEVEVRASQLAEELWEVTIYRLDGVKLWSAVYGWPWTASESGEPNLPSIVSEKLGGIWEAPEPSVSWRDPAGALEAYS